VDPFHAGRRLAQLSTGTGVDNIDYLDSRQLLFVAAGNAAKLTIAKVSDTGDLSQVASVATVPGARTVVVDASGAAYVIDPVHGQVLRAPAP